MAEEQIVNPDVLVEGVDSALNDLSSIAKWADGYDKLRRCGELLEQFSRALNSRFDALRELRTDCELAFERTRSRGEWFSGSPEYRELQKRADALIEELYNDADMFNVEFTECAEVYELASKTAYAKLRASANALFDSFPEV